MGSNFHHHQGLRILFGESPQALPIVGHHSLFEHLSSVIEDANGVLLVSQVDSNSNSR